MPKKKLKDSVSERGSLADSIFSLRHVFATSNEVVSLIDQTADPVMAFSDTVWYVNCGNQSTTEYFAIAAWATGATKHVGDLVRATAPAVLHETVFICIASTSGTGTTSATTQPAWGSATRGQKFTDNSVTWIECGGQASLNGDLTNTPNWTSIKNTAVSQGQFIQSNDGTKILVCTTAGTAGNGSEPSWAAWTNAGATTADNTATWTTVADSNTSHAPSAYTIWSCPFGRLVAAFQTSFAADGSTVYISDAHQEATNSSTTQFSNTGVYSLGYDIICIKNAPATTPPTSVDLSTGALVSGGLNAGANIGGNTNTRFYIYGVELKCTGSGASSVTVCTGQGSYFKCENCKFTVSGSSATIILGPSGSTTDSATIELVNQVVSFAAVGETIQVNAVNLYWRDKSNPITGAAVPTTFLTPIGIGYATVLLEGLDLSTLGSGSTIVGSGGNASGYWCLKDCVINSLATIFAGGINTAGFELEVLRTDSGTEIVRVERHTVNGDLTTSTSIVRTGGASDGTTPYAWQLVSTSTAHWLRRFEVPVLVKILSVSGINVTVTWYGVFNGAAIPNNDEVWIDLEYQGDASDTRGRITTGTKSDFLQAGSPLTADSSLWDSAATARANNHAYTVGDVIAVSTAPGQIWFCTTSGTSSGSIPVGYTSAADGSSVNDGAAVFRAGMRFSQTVTLSSPQINQKGPIYGYLKCGKASSTYFIDPRLSTSA